MSGHTIDPSRTALLRRQFYQDIRRRMMAIAKAIEDLFADSNIVEKTRKPLTFNVTKASFDFADEPTKLKLFKQWLKEQVDAGLLVAEGGIKGRPWTAKYIESAYRKGMMRAYMDVHKRSLRRDVKWYGGAKAQFLRDAFLQPVTVKSLQLLYTRAFDQLQGITADMSVKMGRILADGYVNGYGPKQIAREMVKEITTLSKTRAMAIARTEIINAHSEAQLDGFQLMGIKEVTGEPEVQFTTAGDAVVCSKCKDLEGKRFTIAQARGIIPRHVNCRCVWKAYISPKILRKAGVKA